MYGFTDRAESPVSLSIAQTGGVFSLLMLLLMLLVGWLVGECSWIHKIRRWFLFHGGSGPCNSPQNTRVTLTILFPESLLSRFLHCPVQGFPDQSIILCDPGQWPLDLPSSQETKNASIVVGASEKGGFEGYIVLY